MKAVGYTSPRPIHATDALQDIDLPKSVAKGRDLLVRVLAVSVNPVDTKIRRSASPPAGEARVLGWDAVGIVEATGPDSRLFKAGDAVFYAGAIDRPGTNAEYHLVDERIVGTRPASLSDAEAAAMPLTAITAFEALFDRLDIRRPVPGAANAILIVGGAGGVGSIAIQLVKALTDVTVIATASRPETKDWVRVLGADHVIDHGKPLSSEVAALGIGAPAFVFSTVQTDQHYDQIIELIAPQGRLALIDDPEKPLDIMKLKRKSLSLHWELMFTRSLYGTADMAEQGKLLNEISGLVDAGRIRSTLAENFGTINAANLMRAHAQIESGKARGKIVLEGF